MYKSLDKKAINVMRINAVIYGIIILIILLIAVYFIFPYLENTLQIILIVLSSLIIVFLILNILVFPPLRYKSQKYLITKDKIEVKTGMFYTKTVIIQIKRVQKIELSSGPVNRHFNLVNVHIYTAAGLVTIKFLNPKEAKKISNKVNTLLKKELQK